MTPGSVAESIPARGQFSTDTLGDKLLALVLVFRPSDGWLSVLLLALNLRAMGRGLREVLDASRQRREQHAS